MPEYPVDTERVLIDRLLDSLQELPDVQIDSGNPSDGTLEGRYCDVHLSMRVAGNSITLLVDVKKSIYPRDVRQVLWQYKGSSHNLPPRVQYLLAAELISPGAKELLRAERIGYYDSGGSLFLSLPGAYIHIDKPPPKTLERSVRSLFSGRRAQVLHTLLLNTGNWFGVTAVAEQARVAPSTVSEVLGALERFDWLSSRGQGPSKERCLRAPGALLDAWVTQLATLRTPALCRYYVPGLKADALADRLGEAFEAHQVDYALTHEAAAQRYAPFLSGISLVRTRFLPSARADAAMTELGARIVDEGVNLVVIETKSAGELLFRQPVGNVWLATPIQVYLDLLRGEGRAKEMAEHLRRERIGF